MSVRIAAKRPYFVVVALASVALVSTGCGGEKGDDAAADGETSTAIAEASPVATAADSDVEENADTADSEANACTVLLDLQQYLGVLDTGMVDDAGETAESVAAARDLLASAEPPAELETAWADLTAFYGAVADALAAADFAAGESTKDALGGDLADIPATVDPAVNGATKVETYIGTECPGGATTAPDTSAGVQLCTVLTDDDLGKVFGEGGIPELRDASWGPEAQECIWETGDDETTVSLMLIPRADFESEYLEPSGQPRETVDELENGELHTGTLGLGRFSTRGSSVFFTAGDWGGTANVRTGEDGDAAVDDQFAIEFAIKVAAAVS